MTVSRSQPSRPTLSSLQAQIEELKLRVATLERELQHDKEAREGIRWRNKLANG